MDDLAQGESRVTIFTNSKAEIIDVVAFIHLGNFIASCGYKGHQDELLAHLMPRILGLDVKISDISERNIVQVEFSKQTRAAIHEKTTVAELWSNMRLHISPKDIGGQSPVSKEAFDQWRIDNTIPWYNHEIHTKTRPYSCGLGEFVHKAKGCYIGQEILVRMDSRQTYGKQLAKVCTNDAKPDEITTKGDDFSLVISKNQ